MLLTITTTDSPATDLGYLLHKRPGRVQSFDTGVGTAHVFYPEATDARCTAALLLEIDPVGLVRRGVKFPRADAYVNDRPYVASSFMSVAIGKVFRTAMSGRSGERPEAASSPMPLSATLACVPCVGGVEVAERLFTPLGYRVTATTHPLDDAFPEWGPSPYITLTIDGSVLLKDLLTHLYVLIPVLDAGKHYWIDADEVDKLLRHGDGWLGQHPERDFIVNRYLKRDRSLTAAALDQLLRDNPELDEDADAKDAEETEVERPVRLHDLRLETVVGVLRDSGARRVLDLGCGAGKLLRTLIREPQFVQIVGADLSHRALETAARRLRLDQMPAFQRERISLLHTALTYRDRRLEGFDAAAVVEVIEHLDAPRLEGFSKALFGAARPKLVVVTTPNREYNVLFPGMEPGTMRHRDHRFEWTRAEFAAWVSQVCDVHGYTAETRPLGPEDATHGAPSQMAVFHLAA